MDLIFGIIGGSIGTAVIGWIFSSFIPNEKFHKWGFKLGRKFSALGNTYLGNWEKIENNLTGSFLSFAKGFEEGADSDNGIK